MVLPGSSVTLAARWQVTVELGHFALILAFLCALVQCTIPLIGTQRGWVSWMRVVAPASFAQFILTALSFAALTNAFIQSDFSVSLVATNSHSAKPLLYKLSGVWGNHEGSMLLWVLVLSLFSCLVAVFGRQLPVHLKSLTLAVQAAVSSAFFAFILFTSNPFERRFPVPFEGAGLNPLLQDPGLAFHPPFLYMGYVGLSVSFSFAVAALLRGRVDAAWARWVRPWTLASWVFLTIGIALGSWWAYYELGWGGWWFWDPVENASFMPWLFATALLHSATVTEKREALRNWTLLLAILAFSFSLLGTFLVRSGIITSVHTFASDPGRGIFILAILLVFSGGALCLYGWRGASMVPSGAFAAVSRETALIANNLLLAVAAIVVFLGTFWPLAAELIFGRTLSVGPPFFNIAVTPFLAALAAILPIGAALPWKRGAITVVLWRMRMALAASLLSGVAVLIYQSGGPVVGWLGMAIAVWLAGGVLIDFWQRVAPRRQELGVTLRRVIGLPGSEWGKALAHGGLAITIAGISAITAWETEVIRTSNPGDHYQISGQYGLRFERADTVAGPNYRAQQAEFTLLADGEPVAQLFPERRFYPASGMTTTEAAIDMGFLRDVYVVIGDPQPSGVTVKAYVKPLANWIWLGAIVMSLGGLVSLTDRRYRLAAGQQRTSFVPAQG